MAVGARLAALGLMLATFSAGLPAQRPAQGPAQAELEVYVVTLGQGALYWEKYGHNMLYFRDASTGLDLAFNWGSFDFTRPGYLQRVIVGDPQYWVDTLPGRLVFDFYRRHDRSITLQRLAFTPAQAARALALARDNAREENKYYRYDYFLDNCSTRIRDLVDTVLDGALRRAWADTTALTYRSETVRLLDDMKLPQLGVILALGRPADVPLTVWESGFIPMRLRDALRGAVADGAPVVTEERMVFTSARWSDGADATRVWIWYALIGAALAIDVAGLAMLAGRHRGIDIAWRVEAAAWTALTGVFGVVVLLGWLTTRHTFWYDNENLLLANPLSLAVTVLTLMALRNARWNRPAAIAAIVVAMTSALALVVKTLPGAQDNLAFIALLLPPNFAVAFGLWRQVGSRVAGHGSR